VLFLFDGLISGRSVAARQRTANCTAVALAGLAGLSPLAKRVRGDGSDKLAEEVLHLASCMLEDQVNLLFNIWWMQLSRLCRFGVFVIHGCCCLLYGLPSNHVMPGYAVQASSACMTVHCIYSVLYSHPTSFLPVPCEPAGV
jgi:hypothetical protein